MDKRYKILMLIDEFLLGTSQAIRSVDNYSTHLQEVADVTVGAIVDNMEYVTPYKVVTAKSVSALYMKLLNKKFDIIHIHSAGKIMNMGIRLGKAKDIPVVATIHSNIVAKIEGKYSNLIARNMVNNVIKAYNELDELFVSSPYVAEDLRENGFRGKVSYLPLASDLEYREKKSQMIDVANHYFDIKKSDNVLISLGNVRSTKRIDFALRALKNLKTDGVNYKYFVIGGGEEIPKLEKLAKELGIDERVHFLGYTQDVVMNTLIARADLLLYPSTYDYYGMAKIECAGFGTAGVFIKDSFVANEVFHDINGYVSENNEMAYAKTIANALSDKAKLQEVSKNAYNDLYVTWEKCTAMLYSRLSGIIEEKAKLSRKIRKNDKRKR